MKPSSNIRRSLALTLAAVLTLSLAAPAGAAEIAPTCDETYYATLDPYGNLLESSVVKTYSTHGSGKLVDYGAYDEVINLTDGRSAQQTGGQVTFDLTGDVPDKFYFEGKTTRPYEEFPWRLSLSYALNGVPTPAEELAGKTGVVEITLDAIPNAAASAYSRNNLTLMAASMFNGNDILSLEAPGAQVQLVGNLYCVVFAVLPGEEQHFTIRVGSEDFSYSGMIFLAVPATLDQLSQVADLKEAKEEVEESYDAINASLDVILNTLDGMSGSLLATAGGLDQLNAARGKVSGGKGEVYDKTDAALAGLNGLADGLASLDGYTGDLSQAITDLNGSLNDLNTTTQGLRPELENTRASIAAIQADAEALKGLLTDVEGYQQRASDVSASLAERLEELEADVTDMEESLRKLERALRTTKGVSLLRTSDLLGLLPPEDAERMKTVLKYRDQYEEAVADPAASGVPADTTFEEFLLLGAFQQAYEKQVEAQIQQQITAAYTNYVAQATQAGQPVMALEEFMQLPEVQQQIADGKAAAQAGFQEAFQAFLASDSAEAQEAKATAQAASQAYDEFSAQLPVADTVNSKLKEVNNLVTGLTKPTADVVEELADLCWELDDTGVADDLASLAGLCRDLLGTLKEHEGEGAALVDDLNAAGDLAVRVTQTADAALGHVDSLNGILNTYEPTLQSAITDVQSLSTTAQNALRDTTAALSSAEALLRDVGPALDQGTSQTLSGLSAALRKATAGLDQTDTIRASKDTITGLVEDQWNTHAGEENNLLLMDASAAPESLTDSRNQGVTSIQYVMRSQEIKEAQAEEETGGTAQKEETGSLWDRIKAMFRDIWATITGIFHR